MIKINLNSTMRSILIFLGSLLISSLVIGNAFYQKGQFFTAMVYISKSNINLSIIYLQIFILGLALVKLIKTVYFGSLRPSEIEHVMEKGWFAITETCLAFTLFREEFTPKFVALFVLLLIIKCFHWIGEERVDFMDRIPVISLLFRIRMIALVVTLTVIDTYFIHKAYVVTVTKGSSVHLVFGFEYAILFLTAINIHIKFLLHLVDRFGTSPGSAVSSGSGSGGIWEAKAAYLLALELVMNFFRVTFYITFLGLMMRLHAFPLFAVRPMYMAFKAFKRSLRDAILSRRAIHYMNTMYGPPHPMNDFPDITPKDSKSKGADDIANGTNSGGVGALKGTILCIICREEVKSEQALSCKKLPCGHIFHTQCLRGWFQRQQTCPTCRLDILKVPIIPTNLNNLNINNLPQNQANAFTAGNNLNNQLPIPQPPPNNNNNVNFLIPTFNNVNNGMRPPTFNIYTPNNPMNANANTNNLQNNTIPPMNNYYTNNFSNAPNAYPFNPFNLDQNFNINGNVGCLNTNSSFMNSVPMGTTFIPPPPPPPPPFFPMSYNGFIPIPPFPGTAFNSSQSELNTDSVKQQNSSNLPNKDQNSQGVADKTADTKDDGSLKATTSVPLSEAETLRACESNEITALQSRISILRNVQCLLDSAVLQLTQYMSLAHMPANITGVQNYPRTTNIEPKPTGNRNEVSKEKANSLTKSKLEDGKNNVPNGMKPPKNPFSALSFESSNSKQSPASLSPQLSTGNITSETSEQNETDVIRRRRIEKLSKMQSNTNS